jgi:RHS repeat-associated protein
MDLPAGAFTGVKNTLFFQKMRVYPSCESPVTTLGTEISQPFPFTGKERDEETSYSYFGARYMDHELMTMWLSVDPMADKYPSISPYAYCAWNPVRLVDPEGKEIDLSAIYDYNGNRKKGCESFCKVFEFFAKTSIGQKYLSKYAKKRQIIAGHEYTMDGVFHKKGIDLNVEYGKSQYGVDNRSGFTDANTIKDGRLKVKIRILPESTDADSKANLLETFCHEFFIHAIQYSDDFSSNKASTWKTKNTDATIQHLADINTKHLMRDCAVPILTDYCGGNRQKAIALINQHSDFKNNPSWHK